MSRRRYGLGMAVKLRVGPFVGTVMRGPLGRKLRGVTSVLSVVRCW